MTIKIILEAPSEPMPAADTEAEASSAPPFAAMFDWFGIGVRNVDAIMKALAIFARGDYALNKAALGVALMSAEHAAAAAKGLSTCRTLAEWIDVQNCIVKLGVSRMIGTTCMLSNMAVQVAEDGSVPLTRRMGTNFDEITAKSVA